jgi:DNA-binding LacI/PurR family transcriptional regulator
VPDRQRRDGPTVTLQEVARAAGVSRATASRVLSGSTKVSLRARKAVKRAAEELDYPSAPSPRHPARLRSGCVAVVVTEPTIKLFGDFFFGPLIGGVGEALTEQSLLMAVMTPHSSRDMELAEAYLTGGHVDGVILVSLHGDNPLPRELARAGVPTVICGRPPKNVQASFVDCDNRYAGALAVHHLISLGRRTIAVIAGNLDLNSAMDRLMGYRDALTEAGLELDPTLEEVADYLPDRARMAMERLLLNHPDVDAVFAASDLMAAAALRVLHQTRRRVPEDVAVVGFDDSPTARASRPSLTSVRQPVEEMGRQTAALLLREMAEPAESPRQVVFQTELVIRQSTAGPQVPDAQAAAAAG